MAYYAEEPFGEEREDFRTFMLAVSVLKGLGGKPLKFDDFTPKKSRQRQSVASMQAALLSAVGGRVRYVNKEQ